MSSDREQDEPRYWGVYQGVVVRNDDPEVLGRVTVRVPGVLGGESGWAWPMALPGAGSAQRGFFDVPPVGADVFVQFLGGDPDRPLWCGGNYGKPGGKSEAPTSLQGVVPADQGKVKVFETARWLVTYDDRLGSAGLTLEDKTSGDVIELDGHAMGIVIKATTSVQILATGLVDIKGNTIQIGGRTVIQNGKPIC